MTRQQADRLLTACDHSGHDWVSLVVALERTGLNHLYGELVADISPMNLSAWENQKDRRFADVKAKIERCAEDSK